MILVTLFAFRLSYFHFIFCHLSFLVPGRGYKEYRLEGFSSWLRENVVDSKNWRKIRACLADSDVCPNLSQQFITADQFFSSSSITPLQACSLFLLILF
ncbi:hypothetical protein F2Q70_00019802 [Brassica cretica]|uniref:Uncharacterized protein n=1 Tax=Brassica cretica TaxID=69181 RepID=A0A8S9GTW6_BRACR|nr:hypothetical protein F2Q70_00019802 [Brassica cretica]